MKGFHCPNSVKLRYVCQETGLIPNEYCAQQVMDYSIKERSQN